MKCITTLLTAAQRSPDDILNKQHPKQIHYTTACVKNTWKLITYTNENKLYYIMTKLCHIELDYTHGKTIN